ncbi:1091_t:CDS:2 [Diversispora eburnea]|uniref:1091_t:CDS:1 n=1 Tax=Diversispora eburnea TaxID=1213867 RepID=A0A9N9B308_9GLOM|nr:1091_t:CDS:2 [Diversispora eburnea]
MIINRKFVERDTTTSDDSSSNNDKLGSPVVIALIIIAVAVLVIGLIIILFIFFRRRKKPKSSRGLKPLHLSAAISPEPYRKEMRKKSQPKAPSPYELAEEAKEEAFEESFSEGAVGTRNLPQRSQTMYGTTQPSTLMADLSSSSPHYDVMQQQHHFIMSKSPRYISASKMQERFGISSSSLRRWSTGGRVQTIQTPGRFQFYQLFDVNNSSLKRTTKSKNMHQERQLKISKTSIQTMKSSKTFVLQMQGIQYYWKSLQRKCPSNKEKRQFF